MAIIEMAKHFGKGGSLVTTPGSDKVRDMLEELRRMRVNHIQSTESGGGALEDFDFDPIRKEDTLISVTAQKAGSNPVDISSLCSIKGDSGAIHVADGGPDEENLFITITWFDRNLEKLRAPALEFDRGRPSYLNTENVKQAAVAAVDYQVNFSLDVQAETNVAEGRSITRDIGASSDADGITEWVTVAITPSEYGAGNKAMAATFVAPAAGKEVEYEFRMRSFGWYNSHDEGRSEWSYLRVVRETAAD